MTPPVALAPTNHQCWPHAGVRWSPLPAVPWQILLAAVLLWLSLVAMVPLAPGRTIYLAPTGNDAADGRTPTNAVATLARAIALASAGSDGGAVSVAPGYYRRQTASIDLRQLRGALSIAGSATQIAGYPAFVGDSQQTWLSVSGATAKPTGLSIVRLRVVQYATAVSIEGNRNDAVAGFNSGTVISNNVFGLIGAMGSGGTASTAALRLVNARNMVIRNNTFHTLHNNTASDCAMLHAIYFANFSSGNTISDNNFTDFCGSAIRVRDRSNGNHILHNQFAQAGTRAAGVEEWFCDGTTNADCTKAAGECPSTANTVAGNGFGNIAANLRVIARGNRTLRNWCSAADFTTPRFLGSDAPAGGG